MGKNIEQGRRWLEQAKRDLEDAIVLSEAKSYASSCFHAQQTAEKALKGFLYSKGVRALITHSTVKLLEECSKFESSFLDFLEEGRELDKHYIGSRYPNIYPEGTAYDYYTVEMAEKCIKYATSILNNARGFLSR